MEVEEPIQTYGLLHAMAENFTLEYRVFLQLVDLGWIDFDLGCSTVCQILLRQMGY